MFDIISIGGATRDIFFEFDCLKKVRSGINHSHFLEIPYGEKILAKSTYYSYGGGAVNVAVCGARLGLKTAAICQIGREGTGSLVVDFLRHEKVNTKMVSRDPHLHTGLSIFIMGQDGEHTGFLERGANNHLNLKRNILPKKTRWLYISSLTGTSSRILPDLFEFATKNNIKVAFNPGSSQLDDGYHGLKTYLQDTEILILNYEEAAQLVHTKIKKSPRNEKVLLKEVEKFGSKISVITDAAKGCHAVSGKTTYHERSYSNKITDTTGAGDSFGGTFLFAQIKGFDIKTSLRIASINSASVISKMGSTAGLLNKDAIMNSKWL